MADIFFLKLFEVNVTHDYYTSGSSSDFVFKPTTECKRMLGRYGLLFKSTKTGFVVLYEAKESGLVKVPVRPIDNDTRFTFSIGLNNQNLLNFSELPFDNGQNEIYYFDNLDINKNPGGELLLVDDTVKKFVDKDDVISVSSDNFTFTETTVNPSVSAKILDKFDNEMISKTIGTINGKAICQFDLTRLEAGVYKIEIDGTVKQSFYKDNRMLYERAFGILDLFKNSSVPADYRFAGSDGTVNFRKYFISFHRRSTIWKYFVIKKYKTIAPALTLQVGGNPALTGVPHVLPDGTDSTLFDLVSPSELKEVPLENIKLISSGNVLIQNLPNPGIDIVKPDISDLSKVYSEVYVYI